MKDVKLARLYTFPIFFGQLTGAYEGIGTVSLEILLQLIGFVTLKLACFKHNFQVASSPTLMTDPTNKS